MGRRSVGISQELKARLDAEARRRRTTRSDLVRLLIEDGLNRSDGRRPKPSCADLTHDLIGCVDSGLPDLATNPKYLEEAIIEDYERNRRGLER